MGGVLPDLSSFPIAFRCRQRIRSGKLIKQRRKPLKGTNRLFLLVVVCCGGLAFDCSACVHVCMHHHTLHTLVFQLFQLKSSYEGKCRDLDRAEENHHRLQTNPQSKATDVQKVGWWAGAELWTGGGGCRAEKGSSV